MRRFALSLLLLSAALPALAKDFRVGYVNTDRIIERYEAATEAKRALDAAIAKFEARAESLRQDYEQAKTEYESQQLSLSEEGKRAKAAEVDQRKRVYDGYLAQVYNKGGEIDRKNDELLAPIVQRIDSMVTRVAEDEGYSLVLDAAKSGIVYSASGLDITQLVIDDLNREYEPVTPTGTGKVIYAIMRIQNSDAKAEADRVGYQIREFCYGLISQQPGTDMIANPKVDQELSSRGFTTGEVTQQQALDVARALDADYALWGKCSKEDPRITFELSLVNVRLGTLIGTQPGEARRQDDLQQQVADVIRILLAKVQQP